MLQRHNRRIGVLGLILMVMLPGVSAARTFKFATLAPEGTTWMEQMREGAREISRRTEGRVKIKFYSGGVMGNDKSVLKKMRIGQLHGGAVRAGALAGYYPDIQIYSLPFLFQSFPEVDYVRERLDARLRRGLEEKGLVALGLSEGGFAYFMSKSPIRSLDEATRHKFWLPEGDSLTESVYRSAGIVPVALPLADVYTGLQTGLVDTVGANATAALAFRWHTKLHYVIDVPLMYILGVLVMDKKAFERVGAADQQTMIAVMNDVFTRMNRLNREDNDRARQALRNNGAQFLRLSSQEVARWKTIANQAIAALGDQGEYSPEMLQAVQKYLKEFRNQSAQVNEQ